MAGSTVYLKIDTSELDEAIVKAKILNEELEKAKSLAGELAGSAKETINPEEVFKGVQEQLRKSIRY